MERKTFLKSIPFISLSAGTLLAGCNTTTGSDTELDNTSNYLEGDAALVRDAAEREAIAIQTYTAAAESGIIENQAVIDTAVYYKSHHEEHLNAFNELLVELGGEAVKLSYFQPDERFKTDINSEADAVLLAMALEFEAAEAYSGQIVNALRNQKPRQLFSSIYPVEVSHFVTLKAALGRGPAVNAAFFEGLKAM